MNDELKYAMNLLYIWASYWQYTHERGSNIGDPLKKKFFDYEQKLEINSKKNIRIFKYFDKNIWKCFQKKYKDKIEQLGFQFDSKRKKINQLTNSSNCNDIKEEWDLFIKNLKTLRDLDSLNINHNVHKLLDNLISMDISKNLNNNLSKYFYMFYFKSRNNINEINDNTNSISSTSIFKGLFSFIMFPLLENYKLTSPFNKFPLSLLEIYWNDDLNLSENKSSTNNIMNSESEDLKEIIKKKIFPKRENLYLSKFKNAIDTIFNEEN